MSEQSGNIHGQGHNGEHSLTIPSDHRLASKPSSILSDVVEEPSYLRGYMSDEEVASSVDDDTVSVHSHLTYDSQSDASPSENPSPTCEVIEHACCEAQVVTLVPVGKVRVVSVSKTEPSTPARLPQASHRHTQSATFSQVGSSTTDDSSSSSSSNRLSQSSCTESLASCGAASNDSTAPTTPRHVPRLRRLDSFRRAPPSVPLFEAASTLHSPVASCFSTYTFRESSEFEQVTVSSLRQLFEGPPPPRGSDEPSIAQRRKLSRFPTNLSLTRFGRSLGRRESISTPSDPPRVKREVSPVLPARAESAATESFPHRTQSMRVKMVARGASEREPTLILPPFSMAESQDDLQIHWQPRRSSREAISALPSMHRRSVSSHIRPVMA